MNLPGDATASASERVYGELRLNQQRSWSEFCCPSCNAPFGMEEGDIVHAVGPDRDEYESPSGTRGGWIETRGFCSPCGTGFSLVIANHKGTLTLAIAPRHDERTSAQEGGDS